ncbi:MAG: LysE family translocator [Rhodobacteraceae bacterium]|nr:LysE family translocator [Paracoccaceae bacterium]
MSLLPNFLTLAGMHLLMAMLPGPNTVVVSWLSATRSRRAGLLAVGGVVAATLVWIALALFGVGALLNEAGVLYRALRLAGAGYLLWIGFRMIRAGGKPPGAARPAFSHRNPFATGLMTTLSNPKSAVFWTSVFLVAVPPQAPAWFYAAIPGWIGVQTGLWYGAVALVFSTGFARQRYLRVAGHLDRLAGGVMILLGLRLADEVRREVMVRAAS